MIFIVKHFGMKKIRCFLVVSLISIIAIILTDFTYQFKDILTDARSGSYAGPLLLQFLIVIKYLTLLLVLKPVSININQLSLGFITSDLLIVVLSLGSQNIFMLPLHIMVIQVLVVMIGAWMESGSGLGLIAQKVSFLKSKSITEVI